MSRSATDYRSRETTSDHTARHETPESTRTHRTLSIEVMTDLRDDLEMET